MVVKMRKNCLLTSIVILIILSFIGCATTPKSTVYRPWYRVFTSEQDIKSSSKIAINVTGETVFLLGEEKLLQDNLHDILNNLLSRRGFKFDNDEPDYHIQLQYQTTKEKELYSQFSTSSRASYNTYYAKHNYGVQFASIIESLSYQSLQSSTSIVSEKESFNHTITIEISDRNGVIIWKGESTWNTPNIDITEEALLPMQLILSNLPYDPDCKIMVKKIKSDRLLSFYNLFCDRISFSCPALPYLIEFPSLISSQPGISSSTLTSTLTLPSEIKNPEMLSAYIDLIQNAEYALPNGSKDWSDPLNTKLWSKVILGGKYYMNNNDAPIYILINLTGKKGGYIISGCRVVSDAEYNDFQIQMEKWQKKLNEFFDFYEKQ